MKRMLCMVLSAFLVVSLCACQGEIATSSKGETGSLPISSQITTSTLQSVESIESKSSLDPESSKAEQSSVAPKPTTTSKPKAESQTPKTKKIKLSQHTYTVTDTQNVNGLSTKSHSFSFGVAKNGKPHSQSVSNQRKFNKYKNVDALALDTKTDEKIMYLTFDNGYEHKNLTADILDTLKKKQVKAAFFVTLSYAEDNPKLVRRMIDEGHIVGNHSTTHPVFPTLTRTKMAKEIATLDNYLREEFSYTSPYFRFPTGAYSECSLELVTSLGFRSVFWSVAYADWDTSAQKGKEHAFDTVTARFHPGAVILLHAVSKDNAKALGKIIDKAHAEGYQFKTLDDYPAWTNREPLQEETVS